MSTQDEFKNKTKQIVNAVKNLQHEIDSILSEDEKIEPARCPWCYGSTYVDTFDKESVSYTVYYVRCRFNLSCGANGPIKETKGQAVSAWNKVVMCFYKEEHTEVWNKK